MRHRVLGRVGLLLFVATGMLLTTACKQETDPSQSPPGSPSQTTGDASQLVVADAPKAPLKNEIPPESLEIVMKAHFQGLGLMEQFEYRKAVEQFQIVHAKAPGWIPGSINLAIAHAQR